MNNEIPIYYSSKTKIKAVIAILILVFTIPLVGFLIGWLFYYETSMIVLIVGFGASISVLTLFICRRMFSESFNKSPVFSFGNDGIKTRAGKILFWHFYRDAILFTWDRTEYIGLRKKDEISIFDATDFNQEIETQIFQLPFVLQLDLFTVTKNQILQIIENKLPVKIIEKKFGREMGINFNKLN